ncbi:hypothetical protein [Granulicella sp. S156]|uniref:hypothetical protein n=1 Tax=Granulicella sp. S156 TaxID=1747224 RepID=UPI0020B143EF|nr:hypothetical protein [Granulicella sp. S156]
MRRLLVSSFVVFSAVGSRAVGQQATAPAAPVTATAPTVAVAPAVPTAAPVAASAPAAAMNPDASGKYMLREGDDVDLQFAQDLSSKTSSEGDPVELTLADDLKVGNVVVAKTGAKAFGEVTKAEKSGMMGKAGELNLRLNYLKVGDTKIKLRGTKGKEGESGTTSAVVLTVLFGPIGLIKHGKNVEIKKGQALHAYIGDDITVPPAS